MTILLNRLSEGAALDLLREMTTDTDDAGNELSCVTAEDLLDLECALQDEALGFLPDEEVYRLAAYAAEAW